MRLLLLFLILAAPLFSKAGPMNAPWGKDAALLSKETVCYTVSCGSLIDGSNLLIDFHQRVISPVDGPRSHYIPSSSAYTLQAINRYGFRLGFLMGCDRLIRENADPWVYPTVITRDGDLLKRDPPRLHGRHLRE